MKTIIGILLGLTCAAVTGIAQAQTYDLGVDFTDGVVPSVGIGPDGAWSYGFDEIDTSGNPTNVVNFTPYLYHGGAPAGPDAYFTNGPLSIYQSPGTGGYGVITHDPDVDGARAVIRWTAPTTGTIYVDGKAWKFLFNLGDGRQQDFFVRVNNGPFLAAGTTSDTVLSDGSGPGQNEINWAANTSITAGDKLDIIYLRHPGYVQSFIGFAETITYVPAGSPLITTQPTNLQLQPGASGNLTVAATGTPAPAYQWYKNGVAISGATTTALAINNAGAGNIGLYSVTASNSVNVRTSLTVVVDVVAPAGNVHDATAEFSLLSNPTARGWQYSKSVGNGGTIAGPKSPNWNSGDFGPGQAGWLGANPPGAHAGYARVVQNPNSYDVPSGTLVTHGGSSLLWLPAASDTNHYVYISGGLWNLRHLGRSGTWSLYKNSAVLTSGTIDDSVGTSASPKSFSTGSNGAEGLIANYVPGVDSFRLNLDEEDFQGILLTITSTNVPPDPFITTQPVSQSVPVGATATFTVVATGSNPLNYQWLFNGTSVVGGNTNTLVIPNVQVANVGTYQVVVTSPGGTRHSVIVTLSTSIQPVGTPWDLAGDWQDNIIPPVGIGPEGTWSYGYSPIASANNYFALFTFTPYPFFDGTHSFVAAQSYDATPDVSDPMASEAIVGAFVKSHTSAAANFQPILFRWTAKRAITVNASGSTWTDDTNGRTQDYFVRKNSNAQVFASGTVNDSINQGNPLTWSTNGISLNPGDYIDLIVRRTPGQVQSFIEVTEQIVEAPTGTPHIDVQPSPANQTVAGGATVTYSVTASGSGLHYEWRKDGTAISGATTSALALNNVGTGDAATYTVLVSNGTGDTTSDSVVLAVDAVPPTIVSATRNIVVFNQVVVVFSEAVQATGATNTASYSINNGNSVMAASFDPTLTTVTLTLANGIDNTLTHTLTVNGVKDTVGNTIAANSQVTINVPNDNVRVGYNLGGTNDLVVLEAEHYNQNTPGGGVTWLFTNNFPPFLLPTATDTNVSGSGCMFTPNNGATFSYNPGDRPTGNPLMEYKINFTVAGTYTVWVRGAGDSDIGGSSDSINLGLDGAIAFRINGLFPQAAGYAWGSTPTPAGAALTVPSPGLHVFDLWMREDGFGVDKVVLTQNSSYTPTGVGPTESALAGAAITATRSGPNLVLTWFGGGTLQVSTDITGPFADISGAASPYGVIPSGTHKFYRVRP